MVSETQDHDEIEYLGQKYRYVLTQESETLVSGQIINLSRPDDTTEAEIKDLRDFCLEGEQFFIGLEVLLRTMGIQRDPECTPREELDIDYDWRVYQIPTSEAIGFTVSYKGERKAISITKVNSIIQNVINYKKIRDMFAILRSI